MAEPFSEIEARQIAVTTLRTFMRLPARERSSIILMDVLGYSLSEVCAITGMTLPAVKALLHRGRVRLRDIAAAPEISRCRFFRQRKRRASPSMLIGSTPGTSTLCGTGSPRT